jgi:hypothetical protein
MVKRNHFQEESFTIYQRLSIVKDLLAKIMSFQEVQIDHIAACHIRTISKRTHPKEALKNLHYSIRGHILDP